MFITSFAELDYSPKPKMRNGKEASKVKSHEDKQVKESACKPDVLKMYCRGSST